MTHVVKDGSPSFHRDALKDGQHSESDVVEADDAPLRPLPVQLALGHVRRAREAAARCRVAFNRRHRTRRQFSFTG